MANLANFIEGCKYIGLQCQWGHTQIRAFMDYLYDKHYTVSTLEAQWLALHLVGKALGESIPTEMEVEFQFMKDKDEEAKDDQFPVSCKILLKLCTAEDIVLTRYNILLAKSMFLYAWAFLMHILEFSQTRTSPVGSKKLHNLRVEVIDVDADGLSATFESDKTSLYHKSLCHHTIPWHKLPDFCHSTIRAFILDCPTVAQYFFCTADGQQFHRNDVLDLLDVCLMHMTYCPHRLQCITCQDNVSMCLGFLNENFRVQQD